MAKSEPLSILNKIEDLTIEDKEFTDKETGQIVEYRRIVAHVSLGGEPDFVELVPASAEGKSAYKVLKASDIVA